jgi:hypothetical protein
MRSARQGSALFELSDARGITGGQIEDIVVEWLAAPTLSVTGWLLMQLPTLGIANARCGLRLPTWRRSSDHGRPSSS